MAFQLFNYFKVMPGTSSHTRLPLKGKGLKRINSYGTGDHYIHLKIKIPNKLSTKQKALIQVNLVKIIEFILKITNNF